jgi:hypothetical protein
MSRVESFEKLHNQEAEPPQILSHRLIPPSSSNERIYKQKRNECYTSRSNQKESFIET